jgi:hypothetical protein
MTDLDPNVTFATISFYDNSKTQAPLTAIGIKYSRHHFSQKHSQNVKVTVKLGTGHHIECTLSGGGRVMTACVVDDSQIINDDNRSKDEQLIPKSV